MRLGNCLDGHLGQNVCDKGGVVDWCIVPAGNATDPISRVLSSSDRISFWTLLKPQHSNPNLNPLANQLWCINFLTPPTPLIIPHRLGAFFESLMPLKNWCSIHARCSKSSLKHSYVSVAFFPSLKQNFIAYRSSKKSDGIFEINQLWLSGLVACIPIAAVIWSWNHKNWSVIS